MLLESGTGTLGKGCSGYTGQLPHACLVSGVMSGHLQTRKLYHQSLAAVMLHHTIWWYSSGVASWEEWAATSRAEKMREEKPDLAFPPAPTNRLLRSRRRTTGPPPQSSLTQVGRWSRTYPFSQRVRSRPRDRVHLPAHWNRMVPHHPCEQPGAPPHLPFHHARYHLADWGRWG
jgi:hypothetical protein